MAVIPQEAETVRRIATLYLNGLSYQKISDILNHDAVPFSAEAPRWNKHKVKRLLENPRYTGADGYPAIMDRDNFDTIQSIIQEKTSNYTKAEDRPTQRLKEYLRCGSGGGRLLGVGGKGQRRDTLYLRCEHCGTLVTLPDADLIDEVSRQMAAHDAPAEETYIPWFARNTVDCLKVIRELKARGIAVIFEKENINTLTESSEFLITLFSSFSQAESESMSQNIIPGIRQGMKEGKIPFQYSRTLGYRKGPDGRPEIDPDGAETVRLIYARYLEGRSLGDIQKELVEKNIPTVEGIQGWSRQVIQIILTSEKYIGDGLRQKTYTTGRIEVVKNNGELPMYYAKGNHPAIIPRDIYYRVKEEMARRASKRKVMQKTGKTEQGKYSAKYALSESEGIMAVFIADDTHGDFRRFEKDIFYEQAELTKKDCVMIAGDFGGIWDGSAEEQRQLDWLEKKPFTTMFVSGNHENFDLLAEYPVEEWHGGQVQISAFRFSRLLFKIHFTASLSAIIIVKKAGSVQLTENSCLKKPQSVVPQALRGASFLSAKHKH